MTPANTMKPKFSAAALKAMALEGRLSACEMRAFAARHAATLDADNQIQIQIQIQKQKVRTFVMSTRPARSAHLG